MIPDKDFLVECENSPEVLLTDDLSMLHKKNGGCIFYGGSPRPCTIILDSKSDNPGRTLIHECIHTALHNLSTNTSMEKLSYKINRREDFINELSKELEMVFKFIIEEKTLMTSNKNHTQTKRKMEEASS